MGETRARGGTTYISANSCDLRHVPFPPPPPPSNSPLHSATHMDFPTPFSDSISPAEVLRYLVIPDVPVANAAGFYPLSDKYPAPKWLNGWHAVYKGHYRGIAPHW